LYFGLFVPVAHLFGTCADDTWATDTSAEAVEQRRLELLGNTLAKSLVGGDDEKQKENGMLQDSLPYSLSHHGW